MHQTGLELPGVRRARKDSNVKLIRQGKGWCCWLVQPEIDVQERGFMRVTGMLPKVEWSKIMKDFRDGHVELVVVPVNADVRVDGVKLP